MERVSFLVLASPDVFAGFALIRQYRSRAYPGPLVTSSFYQTRYPFKKSNDRNGDPPSQYEQALSPSHDMREVARSLPFASLPLRISCLRCFDSPGGVLEPQSTARITMRRTSDDDPLGHHRRASASLDLPRWDPNGDGDDDVDLDLDLDLDDGSSRSRASRALFVLALALLASFQACLLSLYNGSSTAGLRDPQYQWLSDSSSSMPPIPR
jgi:hypothetical protein